MISSILVPIKLKTNQDVTVFPLRVLTTVYPQYRLRSIHEITDVFVLSVVLWCYDGCGLQQSLQKFEAFGSKDIHCDVKKC